MYRSRWYKKTPQEVKPWLCTQKLRMIYFPTLVHYLSAIDQTAYQWLLVQLEKARPLERISIELWREFPETMRYLSKEGFGKCTPTALRRFREKYFKAGKIPNPNQQVQTLHLQLQQIRNTLKLAQESSQRLLDAEERLGIATKIGGKLAEQQFRLAERAVKLQIQLLAYRLQ